MRFSSYGCFLYDTASTVHSCYVKFEETLKNTFFRYPKLYLSEIMTMLVDHLVYIVQVYIKIYRSKIQTMHKILLKWKFCLFKLEVPRMDCIFFSEQKLIDVIMSDLIDVW